VKLPLIVLLLSSLFCTLNLQAQVPGAETPATTTYNRDTLTVSKDSVIIVITACAPICSSIVITEDANGDKTGEITSPYPDAIFPEAYIENDSIKWRDNTYLILDEDEKRWKEEQKKWPENTPKQ
jgi:hypothetical protein